MAETTTITKPAPIIEGALTSFLETIKKLQPGTIPAGGFTGIDTSKFAPSIADESQLQQFARTQAGGLGALMPQQAGETAQQFADRQAAFETARAAGTAGLVGADAYQAFMSPYQQDVIDASVAEFDRQAAKGLAGIGQTAAMSGNLGGGREGVMRSEYQSQSDLNRALLQSGLLQQGFTQANQLANQAFGQQRTLATQVPELARQDVSQLGLLGGLQQAQAQAQLDAT